jgi:hypothetical protein
MLLDLVFSQVAESVLICGHTHIAWVRENSGWLALNPGSVCGPLDGFVGAEYALLAWENGCWSAELRRVKYDISLVRAAFSESGMLDEGGALARAFFVQHRDG